MRNITGTEGVESAPAVKSLENLTRCQYNDVSADFMISFEQYTTSPNFFLTRLCNSPKRRGYCTDRNLLTKVCSIYPFQVMKIVRMVTDLTRPLLLHSKQLAVVSFVRDPRGGLLSRSKMSWCKENMDCTEQSLCSDLVSDYYAIKSVRKLAVDYPHNRESQESVEG